MTMQDIQIEHREFARLNVSLQIPYASGEQWYPVTTADLGLGGLGLKAKMRPHLELSLGCDYEVMTNL